MDKMNDENIATATLYLGYGCTRMVGRLGGDYTIKYDPELYAWHVFYKLTLNDNPHVIAMHFDYYSCMSNTLLDDLLQRVYVGMAELFFRLH